MSLTGSYEVQKYKNQATFINKQKITNVDNLFQETDLLLSLVFSVS